MELEESKKIINDFIMYCRFNEKRKYNDEQLVKAIAIYFTRTIGGEINEPITED